MLFLGLKVQQIQSAVESIRLVCKQARSGAKQAEIFEQITKGFSLLTYLVFMLQHFSIESD